MKSILKFFAGILLVQALTAAQVVLALRSQQPEVWLMLALFAVTTGLLAALWLSRVAIHAAQDAIAKANERFLREREKVRTQAEKEKAKVFARSQQQMARERSRTQAKANFKIGAAVAGVLGIGGFVLLTQFVTLGLLALTSAGGAVGGYLFRVRQEQQRRRQELSSQALESSGSEKLIGSGRASQLLTGERVDVS